MKKKIFKNILLCFFLTLNSVVLSASSFITDKDIKEVKLKLKKFGINEASSKALLIGIQENRASEIERQLMKSIKLDGRNYLAYYALGAYYEDEKYGKDKKKAVKYYEKALNINPDVPFIYEKLGNNYKEMGNYVKALEVYEKMIKKFPELLGGYLGAGTINIYRGDEKKGTDYLNKSVELYNKERKLELMSNISKARTVVSPEETEKSIKKQEEREISVQNLSKDKNYSMPLSPEYTRIEEIPPLPVAPSISLENFGSNKKDKMDHSGNSRDKRKIEKEKIKAEVASIFLYFEKKDYNKGFSMFFEKYSDIVDILDDKSVEETVEIIKKYNEKIKNTDSNLYEKNIKKFKELDIL